MYFLCNKVAALPLHAACNIVTLPDARRQGGKLKGNEFLDEKETDDRVRPKSQPDAGLEPATVRF